VGESKANDAHFEVGHNIREVIIKNGGTLPENFPTPDKSIKEIEKDIKYVK
jgi:DNA-damage-inducible protein D